MRDISMLTARELEVLRRISEGQSTRQIARGLRISPSTVYTHVRSMFLKLGVRTRGQAAALAADDNDINAAICANPAIRTNPAIRANAITTAAATTVAPTDVTTTIAIRAYVTTAAAATGAAPTGAAAATTTAAAATTSSTHLAPPPAPFDSLTRREIEVLRYIAEGLPYVAIAEQLVLSPNTVRTHVRSVLAKLGVSSALAAGALVRRVMSAPVY